MKSTVLSAALAILGATTALADPAGLAPLVFDAPHHGRAVSGVVWYPAGGPGKTISYAENPVFRGVEVQEQAPVLAGRHPVVLLSHGMGGEVRSMAWLGTALAERGAIVIAVTHPNTTWQDFDLALGTRHWTRAQDLSLALDVVAQTPAFAAHLDMDRVMAAGFSYGGWTALSLGGLRGNHAGYAAHCGSHSETSSHCADMTRAGISLADFPEEAWNASYADPRVSQVVALDPGLVWGLTGQDVAGLVPDVTLIGLGDETTRLLAADFDASGFAALVPDATIDRIVPALHFTAMPLCKPMGAAILEEEEDDPVCTDPEGADRAAVHDAIVARIAGKLGL